MGGHRRDRHGPLAPARAKVLPMPALSPVEPPGWLLTGLGVAAQRFVRAVYTECEVTATEGHILRIAAEAFDDSTRARRARDGKAARAASRQFLMALQRLGLPAPPEDTK
ncbi:MAG: hypothetical protein HYY76_00910 [Acidobacteria bacterium]|nr:hypothetical protein [Acidobacteriota bacterium]